jgi:D-amino peptidase
MRILLQTDMEGVSWLTDHREIWPAFPEYWRTGRTRLTADVVAAAIGLLDGGATEVGVRNGHGFGTWPNIVVADLPDRVALVPKPMAAGEFDATFQVGYHARCGTPDGFLAHTFVPGLAVALNDAPITESHSAALNSGVPLLGVVGDAALGRQLTGPLDGTPFLAVKQSTSKRDTIATCADPAASALAIRTFAERCVRERHERTPPVLPARFRLEYAMAPELAATVAGKHGFVLISPAVIRLDASEWAATEGARAAAIRAAAQPFFDACGDLDLSSEAALGLQALDGIERVRRFAMDFAASEDAAWRTT